MSKSLAQLLLDTVELRAGGVITEQEISVLKRRWRPRPARPGVTRPDPYSECCAFMEHGPFRISREQGGKGIACLRHLVLRKDGEPRDTQWTRANIRPEVIRILRGFSHFALVDWAWDTTSGGWSYPHPIYRCYATDGAAFDYVARPWQSGQSEVL